MSLHSKATLAFTAALLLGGCLERELKPLNPCLVSGVVAEIAVTNIDKVDLLFVIDNSGSMREEQKALRAQFPKLVSLLTSGVRPNGDTFSPATDLHLGDDADRPQPTDCSLETVVVRTALETLSPDRRRA